MRKYDIFSVPVYLFKWWRRGISFEERKWYYFFLKELLKKNRQVGKMERFDNVMQKQSRRNCGCADEKKNGNDNRAGIWICTYSSNKILFYGFGKSALRILLLFCFWKYLDWYGEIKREIKEAIIFWRGIWF